MPCPVPHRGVISAYVTSAAAAGAGRGQRARRAMSAGTGPRTGSREQNHTCEGRVFRGGSVLVGPQRHDVVRGGAWCVRPGLVLGVDGGGEGELGDLVAQVADLLELLGDGLAEPGVGLAEEILLAGDRRLRPGSRSG